MSSTQGFANSFCRRGLLLAPAFLLVTAGFAQQQPQAPAGVSNFHIVNDHICRGGQPTAAGFQSLAKMGVKTVIDLREADGNMLAEKKMVESAGMKFVNVPMHGMETPHPEDVAKVLAVFNDKDAGKVFVHCKRGADRTGTVVACYRISHDHWANVKALQEAKDNGMAWIQRAMHHYVLGYKPPMVDASAALPGSVN
jgi:protein tyrosine/serine phosphatase